MKRLLVVVIVMAFAMPCFAQSAPLPKPGTKPGANAAVSKPSVTAPATSPALPVSLPGTEVCHVKSRVNGANYRLRVSLPYGYTSGQASYPVLYVLDGSIVFGLAVDAYRLLWLGNSIPDLILVGIGSEEDDPLGATGLFWDERLRDDTPTPGSWFGKRPIGGGAATFLRVLREEIFPFIASHYRATSSDRGISGYSGGGLFAAYVLLHQPDTFSRYGIGSPALWWDKGICFEDEKAYAEHHQDLQARVFLSVGGSEGDTMTLPMNRLAKALQDRHYPHLELESQVIPGETHLSGCPTTLVKSLRYLYRKPSVTVDARAMQEFVGTWRFGPDDIMTISIAGDHLLADLTIGGDKVNEELVAESRDRWFSQVTGDMTKLDFERDSTGRPIRVRRSLYGPVAIGWKE